MPDIFHYIKKAATESPRPVILEIGAARGEDTVKIADIILNSSGGLYEYYAFEPDPRNIAAFKDSRAIHFTHLLPVAVGDGNKRTVFHQSGGTNPSFGYEHTLSGSLKRPVQHLAVHPWCKFDKTTEVRMITLDAFHEMFSIDRIDFIWCDVQGAEDLVLEGGMFALRHTRYFYTEFYDNEMYAGQLPASEIHRRLGPGWTVVERYPNDILFENTCFRRSQLLPQPMAA